MQVLGGEISWFVLTRTHTQRMHCSPFLATVRVCTMLEHRVARMNDGKVVATREVYPNKLHLADERLYRTWSLSCLYMCDEAWVPQRVSC